MAKQKKKQSNKLKKETVTSPVEVQNSAPNRLNPLLVCFLIFVAAMMPYIQTVNYEYVLDDQIVLTDNQYTNKGFAGISDILSTESFAGYFGEQKDLLPGARYRPLSIVSFAIEHEFFGQNSTASHVINFLLYGFLCLVIFFTLLKVFDQKDAGLIVSVPLMATIIYALHPLHTEVVANVKGRDEILVMLFSMTTLYTIFKSLDSRRWLWITLGGTSFFLALLAKENALTFFAIIPLTIYFFRDKPWKDILISSLVLSIVVAAYFILRYNVIGYIFSNGAASDDIMNNPFLGMSIAEKYATIMYTLGHYLRLHIIPYPLTHDYYPFQIPTMHWLKPQTIISLLIYLLLIAASLKAMFNKKTWAYGILFYLVSLSIVSNIVINVGTTMNERFVFMPSLGICIALAWLLLKFLPKLNNSWGVQVSKFLQATIFIGFLLIANFRVPAWENPETLNAAAVKVSTNSARANSFMATALYDKIQNGQVPQTEMNKTIQEADYYANRSIEIFPGYTNGNLMKAGISAEKYKQSNDLDVLLEDFKAVAIRRPDIKFLHDYFEYLGRNRDQTKLYNFYFDVGYNHLYKSRNYQWALTYLTYAYQIDQNRYDINQAMYETYTALGQSNKAAEFGYKAQSLRSNG